MLDVERMPQRIGIGRETETGVTDIEIDVSAWRRKWPGLTISAMHTPHGGSPYVLDTELQGDTLVWHVSDADTASAGEGQMEIIGTADGVRKLSCVVGVVVTGRMPGTVGDAPEAAKPWADKVLAAAESVRSSAEDARESAGIAQASAEAAQEAAEGVVTAEAERVQAEQARQEAEKAREDVLTSKLTEPASGLEVGKYFRIAAINENGHAVLEAVDLPSSPVVGLSTQPSLWPLWTSDEQAAAQERIGLDKHYDLIDTLTIDDESAWLVKRDAEPDGTPYSFKKVMVRIMSGNVNMSGLCRVVYCHRNDANKYDGDYSAIYYNASNNSTSILCEKQNGLWISKAVISNANGITRNECSEVDTRNMDYDLITGVSVQYNNNYILGTKIEIYGVRA